MKTILFIIFFSLSSYGKNDLVIFISDREVSKPSRLIESILNESETKQHLKQKNIKVVMYYGQEVEEYCKTLKIKNYPTLIYFKRVGNELYRTKTLDKDINTGSIYNFFGIKWTIMTGKYTCLPGGL